MNQNLAFDFVVDKEKKTINVKREFAAELALVWDAYTKSEILDQWWAPKPWKARTKKMDFRQGGYWLYAMVGPEGEEHWARADFKVVELLKGFACHDSFADSDGNINKEMPESEWDVTFMSRGQNTLVEFEISYNDLTHLEATIAMGFKEGFAMAMENLDALLPTLKK